MTVITSMPATGQFVAEHVIGVNHDHYFSYRLDFDVDGAANSFMLNRLVPQRVTGDPMRKSIWVNQPFIAQREKEAILDIRLDQPAMWMFMNPSVKGPLNYPAGYELMPGATAKSILSPDDPQGIGAFSEHQFWVTPTPPPNVTQPAPTRPGPRERWPGRMDAGQRNIANTDIVGWALGFHHVTRAEDWPVMPVMWHEFTIRPFHFFQKNPVPISRGAWAGNEPTPVRYGPHE